MNTTISHEEQSSAGPRQNGEGCQKELLQGGAGEAAPVDAGDQRPAQAAVRIPLTRGGFAIVDAEDVERCHAHLWFGMPQGYARCRARKQNLHNFVFGNPHDGLVVDHVNGNRLDCRKSNLRWASASQNCSNAKKRKNAKTSKFKGVHFAARTKRWVAQI